MNFNLKTFTLAIFGVICLLGLSSDKSSAQTNIQSIIQTTGSSSTYLEKKIGVIHFELKSSASNATKAESILTNHLKKIAIDNESSLTVLDKKYLGATSDPQIIVKGTPIQVRYSVVLTVPISSSANMLDQLVLNENIEQIKFSTKNDDAGVDIKKAYSEAVSNAKSKAEAIAKANNLVIRKILEVNLSEEAPPSSIRAQLENNADDLDSGPKEIRVFANARFEIGDKNPNISQNNQ